MVDNYKGANMDIANVGKGISELLLVHIDPHRVYENLEFEDDQVFADDSNDDIGCLSRHKLKPSWTKCSMLAVGG